MKFKHYDAQVKTMTLNQRVETLRDLTTGPIEDRLILRFARRRLLVSARSDLSPMTLQERIIFEDYYRQTAPDDFGFVANISTLYAKWSSIFSCLEHFAVCLDGCFNGDVQNKFEALGKVMIAEETLQDSVFNLSIVLKVNLFKLGEQLGLFDPASLHKPRPGIARNLIDLELFSVEDFAAELDLQRLIDLDAFEGLWEVYQNRLTRGDHAATKS